MTMIEQLSPTLALFTRFPVRLARVILTNMRNPSPAMLSQFTSPAFDSLTPEQATAVWQAMIDAALKEQP
jgi:hypothetical protein